MFHVRPVQKQGEIFTRRNVHPTVREVWCLSNEWDPPEFKGVDHENITNLYTREYAGENYLRNNYGA